MSDYNSPEFITELREVIQQLDKDIENLNQTIHTLEYMEMFDQAEEMKIIRNHLIILHRAELTKRI